jgi:hypothetical protein
MQQVEYFGEGNRVCVLYAIQSPDGDVSGVQIYRIEDSKIAETWVSGSAAGQLWTWDPAITGDKTPNANKAVIRRWYDEVYRHRDWQRVPEVAGPVFLRHEATGTFEATAEEHSKRLLRGFESGAGPMVLEYQVIAGSDKVAVIGTYPARGWNWVQAWRVRDGKLVESWWPGFTEW